MARAFPVVMNETVKEGEVFLSGYVTLIGKPNVGKSTLLNRLAGEKVAIVAPRPQTTRHVIRGVRHMAAGQIVFVDTPGVHTPKHLLGSRIVQAALDSLEGVDGVYFLVNPQAPAKEDMAIIDALARIDTPVFLVINKVDKVRKDTLLGLIDTFGSLRPFTGIFLISALKGDGVEELAEKTLSYLPEGPPYYPEDRVTDAMERFMVEEIIREKIILSTKDELPHAVAVEVVQWTVRGDGFVSLGANIYIEKESQKGIIIGKGGSLLKSIGTRARRDIERLLDAGVYLKLFVKVKKDWRKDAAALKDLGFR